MVGVGAGGQMIQELEQVEEAGTIYIRIRSLVFNPFAALVA